MTESTNPEIEETDVAAASEQAVTDGAAEDGTEAALEGNTAADGAKAPKVSAGRARLDAEGDAAADFLEELLDILDMDGDIDISVEAGRAKVAIVSPDGPSQDLRRLVGPDGEVLEALQELARLAVQSETGDMSRLMLDIADFRAGRKERLAEDARAAIATVKQTGAKLAMPAMNAFERKVVHDVVLEAGLVSESEGEDPNRHVVVLPA